MTAYKKFFRKEDIGFYNDFKKEIEKHLEKIEQPYKSHKEINEESKYETIKRLEEDPKYKHLFNQKKYNKIVKIIDILAIDERKVIRLYTEKVNDIEYFRRGGNKYTPEIIYEVSEDKDENGEFIFTGIPGTFNCFKAKIEELIKTIELNFLDKTKEEEEKTKEIWYSN